MSATSRQLTGEPRQPRHTMGCILCTFLDSACTGVQVPPTMLANARGAAVPMYRCQVPRDSLQNHRVDEITRPVSSCCSWWLGPSSFGTGSISRMPKTSESICCCANQLVTKAPAYDLRDPHDYRDGALRDHALRDHAVRDPPRVRIPERDLKISNPSRIGSNRLLGLNQRWKSATRNNRPIKILAFRGGFEGWLHWLNLPSETLWRLAIRTVHQKGHHFQIPTVYHGNLKLRSAWTILNLRQYFQ